MSQSWSKEFVTKQDLLITLGVIVAILWVGDKDSVLKTIDGVKRNLGGLLTPDDKASDAREIPR